VLAACNAPAPSAPARLPPVGAALALGVTPVSVDARGVPRMLRAGPQLARRTGSASDLGVAYVRQLAPAWGVRAVPDLAVLGEIPARGGAIARVQQTLDGIPIDRGELRVLVRSSGELVAITGTLVDADTRRATVFALDAAAAIARTERIEAIDSARARATRIWYGDSAGLVAAWDVEAYSAPGARPDGWRTVISASDGRVLAHVSLAQNDGFDYRVFADTTGDFRPHAPVGDFDPHPTSVPDGTYPALASSSLIHVTGFNHPAGSSGPDPWLPPGACETLGNNVDAYTDITQPSGYNGSDYRATCTSPGAFDRDYDPSQPPLFTQDQDMAVLASLFYTTNWLHDFWYDAGFTEAAGNAQTDNYGRGGIPGDVLNITSTPAARDNARMVVMPDGMSPHMMVYVWDGAEARSLAITPTGTAITETNVAKFGPTSFDASGSLVVAPTDACAPIGTSLSGQIAIVNTAVCTPKTQALNLQNAGALGMVYIDHSLPWTAARLVDDTTITTPITIGTIVVTAAEAAGLEADIAANPRTAAIHRLHGPDLDGCLDYQLVAHEFGHYLHRRLSPICDNAICNAMSEGWGDFDALLTTVRPDDDLHGAFPIAVYSTQGWADDPGFFGIRRIAYSVDPALDALTFHHMRTDEPLPTSAPIDPNPVANSEVHNSGEVWATALWEVYVAFQDAGTASGDSFQAVHQKVARYIVAGLALTPAGATPTETRDALIAAASADSEADAAIMVAAFARRGFGTCAISAPADSLYFNEIVESKTVNGVLVPGGTTLADDVVACDSDGVLDAGETARLTLSLSNSGYAALSNMTLTLVSSTPGLTVTSQPVALTPLAPFTSTTAEFDVALSDPTATIGSLQLLIATPDGCSPMTTLPADIPLNLNNIAASAATDDFDSVSPAWKSQALTQVTAVWSLQHRTALDGYWLATVPQVIADEALVSPPMTADATAPVTIAITHRFAFAPDNGAVLEYTTDGGTTWLDISTLASPGYNGTIRQYGTALDGRAGFIDANDTYPSTATTTIALGTQLAGQTFQLRFRFAASGHRFISDPPSGWEIDEVATTGAGTPFPATVADPGACGSGSATPPPPGHGGGCCDAGTSAPGGVVLAVLVLALLRRRRSRLAAAACVLVACSPPKRFRPDVDAPVEIDAGPQCTGTQACRGDQILACNADGTFGNLIMTCDAGMECTNGQCAPSCTADGVDLVYVVDLQLDFLSFDPRKLPNDPFTLIGTLACPVTGMSIMRPQQAMATPFSMAIDRDGKAWVEYSSGEVFNVSIADATCTASGYVPEASGMKLFGMGFAPDAAGASAEHLYEVGGSNNPDPGGHLAVVDTHGGQLTPTIVGPIYALSDVMAELTGTNEGRLFGFFPRTATASYVQELDKMTGAAVGAQWRVSAGGLGVDVRAWAFAQWGGRFYVFVSTDNGTGGYTTTVRVVDRSTGLYNIALMNVPYAIVGAGVSICAPSTLP
jgi:uncharacterized protein (TIGR03382 family)